MGQVPNHIVSTLEPDIRRLYRILSQEAKYGHFVRIPRRICRCLDHFKVPAHRAEIIERLHAYYLFIGVVDDLIDSTRIEAGSEILRQLTNRTIFFDSETMESQAKLATEILKTHIERHLYAEVIAKFEELYLAVRRERGAETLAAFIVERKAVGRLTAELSYILISPLVERDREDLCEFLMDVGEVGCLIDSVIDFRSDYEQGLLKFAPGVKDRFRLSVQSLRGGIRLASAHPGLLLSFLEAICDNVLDRVRSRAAAGFPASVESVVRHETGVVSSETLTAIAWIKP